MKADFFSKGLAARSLATLVGTSLARRLGRRRLSALAPAFATAGVLAVSSCSLLESDECCSLEIWPRWGAPTEPLPEHNSSLLDSAGLAGIEVRILGATFVADDFEPSSEGASTVQPRLSVEESGGLSVWVRLMQGSREAALGTLSWTLETNTNWTLMIVRTSQPWWVDLSQDDLCLVNINLCRYERLPIPEDLANYPGEYLWLVLMQYPAKVPDGAIR